MEVDDGPERGIGSVMCLGGGGLCEEAADGADRDGMVRLLIVLMVWAGMPEEVWSARDKAA